MIAQRLVRGAPNAPTSEALHRWLAVLLNDRPPRTSLDMLENVSPNLVFPENTIPALLLFEYLSRPILRLENDLWNEGQGVGSREDVSFEVVTHGGGFWLNDLWARFFRPNLGALIDKLEPIVTSHLQQAHLLSHADGKTEASWDVLSFSRNTVELADQGQSQEGFGVLVDVAFAVMQWNAHHRPSRSDALIELWHAAESFLLKRLAILGVSLSTHWTADRKLTWLIGNDLLYKPFLKHEVFEVLKKAYPQAGAEMRKAVLERALRGRQPVPEGDETTAAYETYNMVYWLQQSDPECALTKDAFEKLRAAHPEFRKREHPDLDVVTGGTWTGWQSPKTVEDLLAKTPKEQIEYLVSFKAETPFGPSREGLLETISDAAARKYGWGIELAAELEARAAWDIDLWPPILRGWAQADLIDDQWRGVLMFLDGREKLHRPFVNELASLLEEGIKKTSKPIPDACMHTAVDLSKRLWSVVCAQGGGLPEKVKDPDWVSMAINHPAGKITLFWLTWLVRERKAAGSSWQGIPEDIRKVLEPISADVTYAGALARVLLASQLNLLSSADEPWTKEHVLPLFDWSLDGKRAVQAFHGFLTWGRQTEKLLADLEPLYEKAFAHLPELGRQRGRFAEYLAGLALAPPINPLTHGWLNKFIAAAELEDRIRWASQVLQMLRGSVDEGRSFAWVSWIKPYWEQRIVGVPTPLNAQELGVMVEWALYLGPAFREVVEVLWGSPKFELKHHFLFRELADSDLPQQYPAAAAMFLLKVLRNIEAPQYDLDKVEDTVRRIASLRAPLDTLRNICNELAKLGYQRAAELQAWLEGELA